MTVVAVYFLLKRRPCRTEARMGGNHVGFSPPRLQLPGMLITIWPVVLIPFDNLCFINKLLPETIPFYG